MDADETPKLEIYPNRHEIVKPIGISVALTCKTNVADPKLISHLEWRDTKNRKIDNTRPEGHMYVQVITKINERLY